MVQLKAEGDTAFSTRNLFKFLTVQLKGNVSAGNHNASRV